MKGKTENITKKLFLHQFPSFFLSDSHQRTKNLDTCRKNTSNCFFCTNKIYSYVPFIHPFNQVFIGLLIHWYVHRLRHSQQNSTLGTGPTHPKKKKGSVYFPFLGKNTFLQKQLSCINRVVVSFNLKLTKDTHICSRSNRKCATFCHPLFISFALTFDFFPGRSSLVKILWIFLFTINNMCVLKYIFFKHWNMHYFYTFFRHT